MEVYHGGPYHGCQSLLITHQSAEHYGEAPYIAMFSKHLKTHTILRQDILDNPFAKEKTGKGIARSEFLVQQGVDVVLITIPLHGKGPEYIFADANVEILMTKRTQLQDIMNTRA